jgi:RHS repeat-associated protein
LAVSVEKWSNYTAFGFDMPGRSVGQDYSYGNNGQMREKETFEGAYSAEYWGYDSRLGRRWETDPISYAFQSPYVTFNNNPIFFADPLGLEGEGGPKKGEKYDCGDGTQEVFNGKEYVPVRNNYLVINESTTSGSWGLSKMQKGNENWKVIVATSMRSAASQIELNNKITNRHTGIAAFLNHGGENVMEFSYGIGGLQQTKTLGALQVRIFFEKGPGNINSLETDDFLNQLTRIANTFGKEGGVFMYLNCYSGKYDANNTDHDANLSLSYQLTRLAAKNNKNIVSVFHNDYTRFDRDYAFFASDEVKYINFDKDLTNPGYQEYGWSVLRVTKDNEVKRQVFGTDIKLNKVGWPLSYGNSGK